MLDSRRSGDDVRRRRECLACKRRFTTYERLAPPEIRVAKRGGASEEFDRHKLLAVVVRVARGRPVGTKACEDLVRGLEAELLDQGTGVIASEKLAEKLLERLRALDPVAAARFATNYAEVDGHLRFTGNAPSPQLALPIALPAPAPAPPPDADASPAPRRPRGRKPGK